MVRAGKRIAGALRDLVMALHPRLTHGGTLATAMEPPVRQTLGARLGVTNDNPGA